MPSQSGINDDELNKMIASLQQEQRGSSVPASDPAGAGHMVVQPPVNNNQPAPAPINLSASEPADSAVPVKNVGEVFGQPAPTPVEPAAQPIDVVTTPDKAVEPARANIGGNTAPATDNLDDIKRQAIVELRPLVDKLNLPAEDKFDTLLLLIRTTDDSSLIPAAHKAATAITDDARRAQALLDVIKEIDFFGQKK